MYGWQMQMVPCTFRGGGVSLVPGPFWGWGTQGVLCTQEGVGTQGLSTQGYSGSEYCGVSTHSQVLTQPDMGPAQGVGTPLPTLLISSGGHQNMYGWQAGGTHPTGMLSCC